MNTSPASSKIAEHKYLARARGIVHIGANEGNERVRYAKRSMDVLFIEALPDLMPTLVDNLRDYPKQYAIQALLTDRDGDEVEFHVSSNGAQSSSIYEFADHSKMWPTVTMTSTVNLITQRFDTLVKERGIDLSPYELLTIDVQGAELLVLKGMGPLLKHFKKLQIEAADFEAYAGATRLDEIIDYCRSFGFAPFSWHLMKYHREVGAYYNVFFERMSPAL